MSIVSCIVCVLLAGPLSRQTISTPQIVFTEAARVDVGLSAIVEKWAADERVRQGGLKSSHAWWPWGLVAFDFDKDGDLDLLAQQHGAPRSMLLRNELNETGKLTFINANPQLGLPSNALAGCFKPNVWDFDGDGYLDLAYSDSQANTCFFNQAGKGFSEMRFAIGQSDLIHTVADFNRDGYLDARADHVTFTYSPKERRFKRAPSEHPLVKRPPPAVADFLGEMQARRENRFLRIRFFENCHLNDDGIPDLICAGFASYSGSSFGRYLLGHADGTFTESTATLGLPTDGTPVLIHNFEGTVGILVAGSGLYVKKNANFELQPGPLTDYLCKRAPYLDQMQLVDFDNDGDLDVVVCKHRAKSVGVFENRGGTQFVSVLEASTWDGEPVAVCDINNDGLVDLCIGGPGDTISIFLNETRSGNNYCQLSPRMPPPNVYAVGAQVVAFRPGEMCKADSKPIFVGVAPTDGNPVHVGLGTLTECDLRLLFPGKHPTVAEHSNVIAGKQYVVRPTGLNERRSNNR